MTPSTTAAQIDALLARPRESEQLEFKEAKTSFDKTKLRQYCVALANEGGGKLVLGVTDKPPRRVVGSQAIENPAKVANEVHDALGFRIDIEPVDHPSGRVVVIHIPSRPRGTAYHHEGAYLMRSGSALVPMSEDQLRRIFDEGKPDWLMQSAQDEVTPQQVVELLDTQRFFDLQRLPYPTTREAVLDRLEANQLIRSTPAGYSVPRLGALLLAKDLTAFPAVQRKAARIVVYNGPSKLDTRLDETWLKGTPPHSRTSFAS